MNAPIGDSIRRRHGGGPRPPAGERPPVRWARIVLVTVLGTIAAFGIGYLLAVLVLFPAPAAAAPGILVPRLIGQDSFYARGALGEHGLRLGTVTQLPDPAAAVGTVVAQDALAGQQLRRGALVNVAVSSGAARAVLPNVTGYAASRAVALLGALGFQVTQQLAPDPTPPGRVVRLSPAPGAEYDLPAGVLLTVSSGPPPPDTTAPADTAAADSGRAGAPAPASPAPGVVPRLGAGNPATPGALAPGAHLPAGAPGVHPPAAAPAAHPPAAAPAAHPPAGAPAAPPVRPAPRDSARHGAAGAAAARVPPSLAGR